MPSDPSWGPMWPHADTKLMQLVQVPVESGVIKVTMHRGIADLTAILLRETNARGYKLRQDRGIWGFANRPIRGSTTKPSRHSNGTAIDIHSADNPLGKPCRWDWPDWMRQLWKDYGWTLGGEWTGRPDPMHAEFNGSTADAANLTARARAQLLGLPQGALIVVANPDIVDGKPAFGGPGAYTVTAAGKVNAQQGAPHLGDLPTTYPDAHLQAPIVAIVPVTGGYALVGADGGVFNFGAAHFAAIPVLVDEYNRGERRMVGADGDDGHLWLVSDKGERYDIAA